jgi:hypothetical protein
LPGLALLRLPQEVNKCVNMIFAIKLSNPFLSWLRG